MHSFLIALVISLTTIAIRFLPFVVFKKKTPAFIMYLGKVLPMAAMAMLVVYCLRNVNFERSSAFVPELIGAAVAIVTYKWKHNTGLSILSSTIIYMLMVQKIFV